MATRALLEVSELFYSIQGESSFSGYPCAFIRLAGCNLRCSYCDAKYTYTEKSYTLSIEDILDYVAKYPGSIVEITGGEPLLQPSCIELIAELVNQGRNILIETNGTIDFSNIPLEATIITDIKCPGSGAEVSFFEQNYTTIKQRNDARYGSCEVKFVLVDINDYNWAKEIVSKHKLNSFAPVHFSPVKTSFSAEKLVDLILNDQLPVRLQIQLHTLLWPEGARGV